MEFKQAGESGHPNVTPLLERAYLFLEEGKWRDADICCEKALEIEPGCAEAYLGKLMAEMQVKNRTQLAECAESFEKSENYAKAVHLGDEAIKNELRGYLARIEARKSAAAAGPVKKRRKLWGMLIPVVVLAAFGGLAFLLFSTPGVKQQLKRANVGDTVIFGSFEQDGNTANGKESIEWVVLSKEGSEAVLISKYGLEAKAYNTELADVTWETCTLRTWLNGEFCNTAFSLKEQEKIVTAKVTADENPKYSTDPGNDTRDKVWLLSITEAKKYFTSDNARMCTPTAYAVQNGAYQSSNKTVNGTGTCWWRLRSPGYRNSCAACVDENGAVYAYGDDVYFDNGCVRPVITIKLS